MKHTTILILASFLLGMIANELLSRLAIVLI